MSTRFLVFASMTIGSILGGYIPTLFGMSLISYSSLLFSTVGGLIGIWIGYRLGD